MRIGYELTSAYDRPSGVGLYTRHLFEALLAQPNNATFVPLANHPTLPPELAARPLSTAGLSAVRSRMAWMQLNLPPRLRQLRLDLVHFTNSIAPIFCPVPSIVSIYDMTLSTMPECHPWRRRALVRPLIALAARRARVVLTSSYASQREIVRLLHLPTAQVQVIGGAAAAHFAPASPAEQARVRATYQLHKPYILYVGTLEPRKNLVRLIRAWHRLYDQGMIDHELVLVGARGWKEGPIFETIAQLGETQALHTLGYLPDADLPALYTAADCFAFPSLAEGFGLPVIEAMACATPCLISHDPALSETTAGAAYQVDGYDVAAISAGLARLLHDQPLRDQLRQRGLQRANQLSWPANAARCQALYRELLGVPTDQPQPSNAPQHS